MLCLCPVQLFCTPWNLCDCCEIAESPSGGSQGCWLFCVDTVWSTLLCSNMREMVIWMQRGMRWDDWQVNWGESSPRCATCEGSLLELQADQLVHIYHFMKMLNVKAEGQTDQHTYLLNENSEFWTRPEVSCLQEIGTFVPPTPPNVYSIWQAVPWSKGNSSFHNTGRSNIFPPPTPFSALVSVALCCNVPTGGRLQISVLVCSVLHLFHSMSPSHLAPDPEPFPVLHRLTDFLLNCTASHGRERKGGGG